MGFLLSIILYIAMVFLVVGLDFNTGSLNTSRLMLFIDLPSFIIVFVPTITLAAGATSWRTLWSATKASFRRRHGMSKQDTADVRACLDLAGNLALLLGGIGTLIGGVVMLQQTTETTALGTASATALMSILYGIGLKILIYAAARRIETE